jgi:hypothetical protein
MRAQLEATEKKIADMRKSKELRLELKKKQQELKRLEEEEAEELKKEDKD